MNCLHGRGIRFKIESDCVLFSFLFKTFCAISSGEKQAGVLLPSTPQPPKAFCEKDELIFCQAFLSNRGSCLSMGEFHWMASLVGTVRFSFVPASSEITCCVVVRRHPFKRVFLLKSNREVQS